tara:strand:+ start:2033 stop:2254 length:222 start_codon:yes stop_codon:yes gene_type:complete
MIELFKKRNRWCYRDTNGRIHKFNTEAEARSSLGLEIVEDAEEKNETKISEEKANTYEQEIVFDSKGNDEEEV